MKRNYKFFSFVVFVCFCSIYNAQEILLYENTPKNFEEIDDNFGPNRKKFNFSSLGFGVPLPINIDSEKVMPNEFGIYFASNKNYKIKINNLFALHSSIGYSSTRYYLNENYSLDMPIQSPSAKKISYLIRNLKANAGFQINFKRKRGNQFGKYINIGMYGDWIFQHKLKYEYPNNDLKIIKTKLNYLEKLNYGLSTKLGIKKNAIFINYRLSDLFNSETDLLELPRLIAGFEFDVFSKNYR